MDMDRKVNLLDWMLEERGVLWKLHTKRLACFEALQEKARWRYDVH